MALEYNLWVVTILLLIYLMLLSLGYTYAQKGQTYGFPGSLRYATFGVVSFIMIGILFLSYIIFLFLVEGLDWTYPYIIGSREFDLANGFWTVLVGVLTGIFLGIFALLKKQEAYGR